MQYLFINTVYAAKSQNLDQFISNVDKYIVNPLITLLFALALLFFVFGVYEFIANQENEEKKTTGKQHMIWGIIGIVIMMGVWTILNMIMNTFNITGIDPEKGTVHLNNYTPPWP